MLKRRKDDISPPAEGETTQRTRFDELLEKFCELQDMFAEFSTKVLVLVCSIFVMFTLSIVGVGYALHKTKNSRLEASRQRCESINKQNNGIRPIIAKFKILSIEKMNESFPIEPDCNAYAKRVIK